MLGRNYSLSQNVGGGLAHLYALCKGGGGKVGGSQLFFWGPMHPNPAPNPVFLLTGRPQSG
jgi:hypothetical protein